MKARLLAIIEEDGFVMVTEEMIDMLFPAPRYVDPIKAFALAFSGNRPEETQSDLIKRFCEINNLEHSTDHNNMNYFKSKK